MCVPSLNGVAGSKEAFHTLESRLPSLKSRKFYGVVVGIPPNDEYKACVALTEHDDPQQLRLTVATIPGGKYAKVKIKDWNHSLDKIGITFESLSKQFSHDNSRGSIEYYRSMTELILYLPIK